MKKKHYNIPVFIPELACPHQCVFCDQVQISGEEKVPQPSEVPDIIEEMLSTMDPATADIEVAFFGGSFTGIPAEDQEAYLQAVQPYLQSQQVKGIRLSTRPDYIDHEILDRLKQYGVTAIELGAQSMDPLVLKRTARGHAVEDVHIAARMIKERGFELGLQMMIGLPEDTLEKAIFTAEEIIKLKADTTRIYPTLIIPNTALHRLYKTNRYTPLKLAEAVQWVAQILPKFEAAGIKVLRTGLHPSEDLRSGKAMVAGPFHPAFKELVQTQIWAEEFEKNLEVFPKNSTVAVEVPESQINFAVGFKKANKLKMEQYLKSRFKVRGNKNLMGYQWSIIESAEKRG
ncbi:elongator complex protein 3 [Persicobacter psychrovividus]|uniref:Radical SAM protein n=1 Tax=Persicobacter psychrovividus TaxID=387638 RepID=A0ABN6L824_9BACT|nr:radical SAM protein [Persicobacter psychrovividus]